MSLDRLLGAAAADLRRASRVDSDLESMLGELEQSHSRRHATDRALLALVVVAILVLGAVAWRWPGGERTIPATTPTNSPTSAPALTGCNLDCEWNHRGSGFLAPGSIQPDGAYRTTWFYPGQLTMTFPDGWSILQDTTGDLNIRTDADPDASVALWLDVTPVSGYRVPQEDVVLSPDGIIQWLRGNRDVRAITRSTTSIGAPPGPTVEASVVDIEVSETAKNYGGENCPTSACVYLFAMDGQWDTLEPSDGRGETVSGWAIASGISNVRLYIASVGPPGHLLYVMLDAPTPARLDALSNSLAPILASLQLSAAAP